ncbi:hypothetical protein [Marinomonas pollencensis]|uniref:Uncharacterized protein n=1 Tax=Marinomonas pollencensis TaxID=491954 RepID=A0A3E0DNH8_9GAMM|nr:hypothetical protein [Marinomonas pollencensis]REG84404.1 hypothetical protein DFP81_104288 [Marinomonas pollencensis]
MVYQVKRSDLKGTYKWDPVEHKGPNDDIDKENGFEILALIQAFYNEREWLTDSNIHAVEAYLKLSFLNEVRSPQKLASYLRSEFS